MSENLGELSNRKGIDRNLFDLLGKAAEKTGTPSSIEIQALAEEFLMGAANVYGTATFYDFLKPENEGKKAFVCNGSACLLAGTQNQVKNELEKHFKAEEIGDMCCLGRCHENKAFHLAGKNYSGDAIEKVSDILSGKGFPIDSYAVDSVGETVLLDVFGLDEYGAAVNKLFSLTRDEVLEELKSSGLRGRGGAGFPAFFKIEACKNAEGDRKFIVCNGDEGDPGAYSDRWLLEARPYAVLMGMMIAGYIAGADTAVVYIRGEYPEAVEAIENAIQTLVDLKLEGKNILGKGFDFRFRAIKAQGSYVCGEETALLSSLEGQRPEVRIRPPYPAQKGLYNRPTVVNNVETLAAMPWILMHSGKKYATIGRGKSTGTKLVCLDGFFNRPGLYEVPMGTPLSVVTDELGKGFRAPIKAMHIGGPLGGLVPVTKIKNLTVDFESFSENGFLLGHASVICIPQDFPLIAYMEHLFEFTSHESCGKCFPCRLGAKRGSELLSKAFHSDYKIDRKLFDDLVETLEIGSLCALGGGLPLPIKNALEHFPAELSKYFQN